MLNLLLGPGYPLLGPGGDLQLLNEAFVLYVKEKIISLLAIFKYLSIILAGVCVCMYPYMYPEVCEGQTLVSSSITSKFIFINKVFH